MENNIKEYSIYPSTLILPGDSFDTDNFQLIGRRVAGKAFIEGIIKNLKENEKIDIVIFSKHEKNQLKNIINKIGGNINNINFYLGYESLDLYKAGNIHIPGPDIDKWSMLRSNHKANLFSITGIIHTLCSSSVINGLKDYLTGGLEEWDSLVCTSKSGEKVVERTINFYHEILERKFKTPLSKKRLPKLITIPLAVDDITSNEKLNRKEKRLNARNKLEIPENSIVILSLGRLSSHSKFHPLTLYRSIARLTTERKNLNVILLECGSFYNEKIKILYEDLVKSIKPLNIKRLGGLNPASEKEKIDALNASDIFISPSDNIQETFGLSVIEAMAASLPCIVSNWNGYKDLVKDKENGFLISTSQIETLNRDLNQIDIDYRIGKINYDYMIGLNSMSTIVDEDEMTNKLIFLADNKDIREKMGENSRQRYNRLFTWEIVSNQYRELWEDLKTRRLQANESEHQKSYYPPINMMFKSYGSNEYKANKLSKFPGSSPPEILLYPLHREFTFLILGNNIQKLIDFINKKSEISIKDLFNLGIPANKHQEIMILLEKLGIAKKVNLN